MEANVEANRELKLVIGSQIGRDNGNLGRGGSNGGSNSN